MFSEIKSIRVALTDISCPSYPRFSMRIRKTTSRGEGALTSFANVNLLSAISVGEVLVSSNGQITPGLIMISIKSNVRSSSLVGSRIGDVTPYCHT